MSRILTMYFVSVVNVKKKYSYKSNPCWQQFIFKIEIYKCNKEVQQSVLYTL